MVRISVDEKAEDLAVRLMKHYSLSGSGFVKTFNALSSDIIAQGMHEGLDLLLKSGGKVSAREIDRMTERSLRNLSCVYCGLVKIPTEADENYKLSDDILHVLYRIFHDNPRLRVNRLEAYSAISRRGGTA